MAQTKKTQPAPRKTVASVTAELEAFKAKVRERVIEEAKANDD